MKLIPRSEFDADLFAEEMGNVHTPKDAESFRDWLLFEGYKSTDEMTNGEWYSLLNSWAEDVNWRETV